MGFHSKNLISILDGYISISCHISILICHYFIAELFIIQIHGNLKLVYSRLQLFAASSLYCLHAEL